MILWLNRSGWDSIFVKVLNGYSDSAPVDKVLISSVAAAADYNKAYMWR